MGMRRAEENRAERRRFRWPAPRHRARSIVGPFLTAAALTAAAAAAMPGGLATLYRVGHETRVTRAVLDDEVLRFVTIEPTTTSRREARLTRSSTLRRAPSEFLGASRTPPAAIDAVEQVSAIATIYSAATGGASGTGRSAIATDSSGMLVSAAFLPASRFPRSAPLTRAARDSLLHQLSLAVPSLALTRRPTLAEVDASYRAEALRQWWWRQQGRPVPIEGGVGTLSLPLFSRGPSPAQRLRDSIVHDGNLLRLSRLADRAWARSESSRVAAAAKAKDAHP